MKTRTLIIAALLSLPFAAQADALFGNDMARDRYLPRTWGIGIDYFNMSQPYQIDSLSLVDTLDTPGGPVPVDLAAALLMGQDPNVLDIDNDIRHGDIKLDVWVLPFLNVFGIYGQIDGATHIDLRVLNLPLPPQTNSLTIDYDGDVYGGGIVLAVGGDRWFGSVTATVTDTSLSGDFKSSVGATTIQPRIGLRFPDHTEIWLGGYFLDADEKHSGTVDLDLGIVGGGLPVDAQDAVFAVDLSQQEDFNFSVGTHMMFSDAWEATIEVGAGDRRTVLANFTYRFD
ncbi:MAG: hypothetical protein OEW64_10540 [Gammaproteobacteria bacterium]|nr:hypothetical protein [Gammaproteobacteria bacterium]MDH5304520.1 hypothetical protein [Gammaproteobacteria bacterium]MDH5322619.1 hypothetical protein [Gammaproteobacteria bacterium]